MEETLYKRVGLPEIGAPDLDARPRHHGRRPEVGAVDDAPAVVGDPERHRRREQVHHVADYPPQHQAVPRHLWRARLSAWCKQFVVSGDMSIEIDDGSIRIRIEAGGGPLSSAPTIYLAAFYIIRSVRCYRRVYGLSFLQSF